MVKSFISRTFALCASALMLFSCHGSDENHRDGRIIEAISFTATRDIALDLTLDRREDASRTKAVLGSDNSVIWSADDTISVFASDAVNTRFGCDKLLNDGASAVFKGEAVLSDTYYALYPAQTGASFDKSVKCITALLPSAQKAVAGGFDPDAALAVACSADSEMNFKNVVALVNFVVRDENISSIVLRGSALESDAALAGNAQIDYNSGNPVASLTEKAESVELTGNFVKGQRYYMAVYPGTYSNLQLVFTDASGRTATFSNPVSLPLDRNSNVCLFDQEIPEAKWVAAPVADTTWRLVTSTSDLVAGDKYVIACNSKGFVATDFSSGAVVLGNAAATFSSDKSTVTTLPSNALVMTLGGTADAWTFSNADGNCLGATTTKKLAWGSGIQTWTISVTTVGTATVTSTKSTYGYIQYNASSPRFTTYTSNQTAVQLYHRSGTAATSVTTGASSDITSSSATLSGSYYCTSAIPSEAGFRYGTSASDLTEKTAVSGIASKYSSFNASLTSLSASTTYYYQAYVIEDGVTYSGNIQNFTTSSAGGGTSTSGEADYCWPELPAQTDKDKDGIDDNNSDFYYSHTFRADASTIRNFSSCYSKSKIHPVWVAAPMHNCYLGSSGRNDSYKADPNIKCTQNGKWTGYTRGHMVGSSDRTVSVATNKQAFYYSNIGAQLSSGFNTGGGVWNNLESKVDSYLCADTLYQVIGCIFDQFTDHYGEVQGKRTSSGSDIPTAYYKALLRTKSGSTGKSVSNCTTDELQCVAFIVIHNSNNHKRSPSSKDLYSISELESLTGLTFFVNVPNAPKSSYNASDWGL